MRYAHHADCSNKPSIAKQEPDGLTKRNGRWRKRKAKWIKAREERKRYSDADTSDANGGDGDVSYASGYEESSDGDATDSASQSSEPAAGSRKQVNAAGDVEAVAPVGDASTVAPADDKDDGAGAPSEWKPTLCDRRTVKTKKMSRNGAEAPIINARICAGFVRRVFFLKRVQHRINPEPQMAPAQEKMALGLSPV